MAKVGRNEHFAINMVGKEISFDVQPYTHGRMKITDIIERDVTVREFNGRRGTQTVTYSVFDIVGEMIEGMNVGALIAGVPVHSTIKNITGKSYTLIGVTYGELWEAAEKGKTIVKVCCG